MTMYKIMQRYRCWGGGGGGGGGFTKGLLAHLLQIRLPNSKITDLDGYFSRQNLKVKFLFLNSLLMPLVTPHRETFISLS